MNTNGFPHFNSFQFAGLQPFCYIIYALLLW